MAKFAANLFSGGSNATTTAGMNSDGMGVRGSNPYHPTVAMLLLLVLLEYATIIALRFLFRHTHGG